MVATLRAEPGTPATPEPVRCVATTYCLFSLKGERQLKQIISIAEVQGTLFYVLSSYFYILDFLS